MKTNIQRIIVFLVEIVFSTVLSAQNPIIKAAENGDVVAQKWLAEQYFEGKNTNYPRNLQLSFKWYLAAAKQGDADSQFELYFIEDFTPAYQSKEEAFSWGIRAANQGHTLATITLGYRLLEENDNRALIYLEKAGPAANVEIGLCYLQGLGTPKNVRKAKLKFHEAIEMNSEMANSGNGLAKTIVGEAYRYLALVSVNEGDEDEAIKYALLSGNYGNTLGYLLASEIYLRHGDKKNAVEILQKGASNGDADCMAKIGVLAYVAGDTEDAISLFRDALEVNERCETALKNIGWCYYKLKNYTKAKEYFTKAIEIGLSSGYNQMAYLYANGYGVKKDTKEAHRLVDIALSKVEVGSSDYVNYLDSKGEFYVIEGNEKDAKDIWNQMINLDKDSERWTTFFAKHMQGTVSESIDDIRNIVAENDNTKTFVVAIGNENYKYEDNVPFANNDVKKIAEYCHRILGVPSTNIKVVEDAGYNDMRYVISWLNKVISVFGEEAKVIFYYAGHGIPDVSNKSSYLLPVDGYGGDTATGYSLTDLYASLGSLSARSVSIFLDACFSGATRDGKMLEATRGVAIKVKKYSPMGNIVVFSAAQGDETAFPYEEQNHGLFTYYLLKKLKESNGDVSLGELSSYIKDNVSKKSIVVNGKSQTPCVTPSDVLGDTWTKWTLK